MGAAGAGNGFSQRFFVPAPTFTTGPWYHIAAVYDGFGRTLTFYLNGDIVEVLNLGSAPPVNLTSAHIGAWLGFDQNFYRFMDGQIDEVAIYATALPPERIAAHYQAAFAPIPPWLNHTRLTGAILFSWEGDGFALQQTTNVANPFAWTDIPNANLSPYQVLTQPGQRFFRLRRP